MPSLKLYIQDLVRKGYDLKTIKNHLLKYGYQERVIDEAIYNFNQTEVKHTIHITKSSLIAIAIIVLGFVAVSFFLFNGDDSPKALLDVNIESIDNNVKAGDELTAAIELINMGSNKRADINMKYEIFDEDDERITFKTETVAIETTKSHSIELKIPEDAEDGEYTLTVTARPPGQVATASAPFRILGEDIETDVSCYDNIKNQGEEGVDCGGPCSDCENEKCPDSCDDNDDTTRDYCDSTTDFECEHEKKEVCGNDICESSETETNCADDCKVEEISYTNPWDELDRIKALAISNSNQAEQDCYKMKITFKDNCLQGVAEMSKKAEICDKITEKYNRNKCFSNVAVALNRPAICENIEEDKRDTCYTDIITTYKDYSLCDKLQYEHLRKNCNMLAQLQG
jgi:hypothetical protein